MGIEKVFERAYSDLPKNKVKLHLLKLKLESRGVNTNNSQRYVILATSSEPWEALGDYDYSVQSIFDAVVEAQ